MFPFSVAVTVYRPGETSWNGDAAPGTTHTVSGCAFWPSGRSGLNASEETTQMQDTITTTFTLMAPAGADIIATDLVWLPGDDTNTPPLWQVRGEPWVIQSPLTGWAPGNQYQIKRVEG